MLDGALTNAAIDGYVDLFGYHSLAGGWFFAGWISRRDGILDSLGNAVAHFGDETASHNVSAILFPRDDVTSEATGFLLFIQGANAIETPFRYLCVEISGLMKNIQPVIQAVRWPESKLIPKLNFLVSLSEAGTQRRAMELLLDGHTGTAGHGYIEYFGYHQAAGGWLASGWVSAWSEDRPLGRAVMSFEDGDVSGEPVATLFSRSDLPEGSQGVIIFVRAPVSTFGSLCAVSMNLGGTRTVLRPITAAPQLREAELSARLRSNLLSAKPGLYRDRLGNLLGRRPYTGEDTLGALAPAIHLYIDEAIQCGAGGLILMGWMLAKPDNIREIRVRCGRLMSVIGPRDLLRINRPDVLAEFTKDGFDDAECGFIAYLPAALDADARPYIEIETQRYETAYRNIGRPVRTGIAAIQKLLGAVDIRFADILPAFDHVLGPAAEALNRDRLAAGAPYQIVEYGGAPVAPKFSVIVPLYGRLDYVEYQFALFSAHRNVYSGVEFIYVLDDPPKRREAQILFASIYQRFGMPFRAVLLDRNLGFAPANNIGLEHAQGEFIAYLNSDVFPGTPDWLERLAVRLEADPQLGVVGPLLLFEDGSVQHRGMYFERLAEYGDWFFCQHLEKGKRYTGGKELQYFISITGACMVLRRELASQVGGFDETYVIGDFEDSDLCLKLQAMGYKCAVEPGVTLYHLERKSQLSGAVSWRANLTAYNAWQHDRRWADTIVQKQQLSVEDLVKRA